MADWMDPIIEAALTGGSLPLAFDDSARGVIVARWRSAGFVALLTVYPTEPDDDEDPSERSPFQHDIEFYERLPDGGFNPRGGGGSDWDLGLDQLPPDSPLWLNPFWVSNSFGTFITGAVADLAQLKELPEFGAEAPPPAADAPTGVFVVRIRDDRASTDEWKSYLTRSMHAAALMDATGTRLPATTAEAMTYFEERGWRLDTRRDGTRARADLTSTATGNVLIEYAVGNTEEEAAWRAALRHILEQEPDNPLLDT